MTDTAQPLDITFTAVLGRVRDGDTWTCVQLPDSATIFGTRGLVKVQGTGLDGRTLRREVHGPGRRLPQAAHQGGSAPRESARATATRSPCT